MREYCDKVVDYVASRFRVASIYVVSTIDAMHLYGEIIITVY